MSFQELIKQSADSPDNPIERIIQLPDGPTDDARIEAAAQGFQIVPAHGAWYVIKPLTLEAAHELYKEATVGYAEYSDLVAAKQKELNKIIDNLRIAFAQKNAEALKQQNWLKFWSATLKDWLKAKVIAVYEATDWDKKVKTIAPGLSVRVKTDVVPCYAPKDVISWAINKQMMAYVTVDKEKFDKFVADMVDGKSDGEAREILDQNGLDFVLVTTKDSVTAVIGAK